MEETIIYNTIRYNTRNDANGQAQEGQVSREEAELVELEREEHLEHSCIRAERRETTEREIARKRGPKEGKTKGRKQGRAASFQLWKLERILRKRKGEYRKRDDHHYASAEV